MLDENFFSSNSTFTMNGKLRVNVEQNIFKSVDIHNTFLYDEPVFWSALQDLRQWFQILTNVTMYPRFE